MKQIILIAICITLTCSGQVPTYFHDTTLDGIQNNVGYVDSAVNNLTNTLPPAFASEGITLDDNVFTNSAWTNGVISSSETNAAFGHALYLMGVLSNSLAQYYPSNSVGNIDATNISGNYGLSNLIPIGTFNGNSYSMDLGRTAFHLLGNTSWYSMCYFINEFILAVSCLILFKFSLEHIFSMVSTMLNQRQIGGSSQEALGVNVALPTGYGYAIVLTGILTTLIGFLLSQSFLPQTYVESFGLLSKLFLLPSSGGSSGGFTFDTSWGPVWDLFTACIPITAIFSLFCNYLLFRFFYCWSLFLFSRAVVLYLIR
jgi:hypothetical protein